MKVYVRKTRKQRGEGKEVPCSVTVKVPGIFSKNQSLMNCQHQLIYGKLNMSLPSPPPYKRRTWDYSKAEVHMIRDAITNIGWTALFEELNPMQMVEVFTNIIYEICSLHIPNRVKKFDDMDPPWMKCELKTAIKRKHRVYAKFVKHGSKPEEWKYVKNIQKETSRMITNAKNECYTSLGRKLSNNVSGVKTYWSILNRLLSKRKVSVLPPLSEN